MRTVSEETTGSKVRRARLWAGLTQQQLARHVGISQAYLSLRENGERRYSDDALAKIAKALGLDPSALKGDDDPLARAWQEGFEDGVRYIALTVERLGANPSDSEHPYGGEEG